MPNNLTEPQKAAKLDILVEDAGFDSLHDMLEEVAHEGMVPAICTSDDCHATQDLEPDAEGGECELCGCQSVDSCMILAGLI